jgi:3-oxoacyl-[acyl-carrier protein] reductase
MDLGISGKTALVTGASQGIGRAIAIGLAREGARVTVVARSADKLEAVVTEMGGGGAGHLAIAADLMVSGEPTRVISKALLKNNSFQIVVHNLGGSLGVRDPLAPTEDWMQMWRLNAGIAIEMNGLLVPPMQKLKWGRIVHISSIHAESVRGNPLYASAKAALNAYVKGLGRAIAADGVVATGIMPGAVAFEGSYWDNVSRNNPTMLNDFLRHHQALGRLGTPEEIAHLVVFLASNQASFAAGDLLPLDGGTM